MTKRAVALCAALLIGLVPAALVGASALASEPIRPTPATGSLARPLSAEPEMDVLSGAGAVPRARTVGPKPRPVARSRVARRATRVPVVAGTGSNYPGTAGFAGAATVALPSAMGGRYTGAVQGHVTVCADRCVRLPAVDWCQCHWGEAEQRVVDLSYAAWELVSDRPLSAGLVEVRVILHDPALAAAWRRG